MKTPVDYGACVEHSRPAQPARHLPRSCYLVGQAARWLDRR